MAKIFSCPSAIPVPKLNFATLKQYDTDCEKFKEDLKKFLNENGRNGKNVGEIVRFPVADGYAEYMVASMRPLELIHLPLWDAWDFQYANRLTAKDIQKKIDGDKAMAKLFSARKNEL